MAKTFNSAELLGRLGTDPILRKTASGMSVCSFPVATERRSRSANAPVDWIDVVCWGKQAEAVVQYIHKGDQIHLQGNIRNEKFEDSNGVTQYRTRIHARTVNFLPNRNYVAGSEEMASEEPPVEAGV